MSSIGTFGAFTQARLAIYASQAGLTVTGNNIANVNTDGYARQKLDQTSFYAGGSDRYYSGFQPQIGSGVLATGVSQLRDPYLDIRYRSEMSSVGAMDAKLAGLEELQRVFDEVGDGDGEFGIISARLNDVVKQLQQLSDQTGQAEYDIQVRSSAESLIWQFQSYNAQIDKVYDNAVAGFKQDIDTVNNLLSNIRELNSSISRAEIHGNRALELRDERNLLLDQLSSYMKINVTYTETDVGGGIMIEKMAVTLDNADKTVLIDDGYAAQLLLPEKVGPDGAQVDNTNFDLTLSPLKDASGRLFYKLTQDKAHTATLTAEQYNQLDADRKPSFQVKDPDTGVITITTYSKTKEGNYLQQVYTKTPSVETALSDTALYGSLQSQREFLTEAGEFTSQDVINGTDAGAATKRGIPFYQNALNLLVNQFATAFNKANQGTLYNEKGQYVDQDGNPLEFPAGTILTTDMNYNDLSDEQKALLEQHSVGCPLFTNGDADYPNGPNGSVITASNITISSEWANGPALVNSFLKPTGLNVGTTDSSNILHMISMMSQDMVYDPTVLNPDATSDNMFKGDFNEMWTNIGSILGNDIKAASTMLDTYYSSSVELDTHRDSVSSVDMNDEAMNLMQYSKSYNAACRLMTTIDSILDKLINGTGMTT